MVPIEVKEEKQPVTPQEAWAPREGVLNGRDVCSFSLRFCKSFYPLKIAGIMLLVGGGVIFHMDRGCDSEAGECKLRSRGLFLMTTGACALGLELFACALSACYCPDRIR